MMKILYEYILVKCSTKILHATIYMNSRVSATNFVGLIQIQVESNHDINSINVYILTKGQLN